MKILDVSIVNALFGMVLAIVSVFALVCPWISYKKNTKTTLLVNSTEHSISERLKHMLPQLIACLRSMDATAANPHKNGFADFEYEIQTISKIQASPEYFFLLKSIDDEKKTLVEEKLKLMVLLNENQNDDFIRFWTHMLVYTLRDDCDLNKAVNQLGDYDTEEWSQQVKELCNMKGIFTGYDYEAAKNRFLN